MALTCPTEALDRGGEALGPRQQVVLEDGQPLGGGHLHADPMLLLREARALTVQEKLRHRQGTEVRAVLATGTGARQAPYRPCTCPGLAAKSWGNVAPQRPERGMTRDAAITLRPRLLHRQQQPCTCSQGMKRHFPERVRQGIPRQQPSDGEWKTKSSIPLPW